MADIDNEDKKEEPPKKASFFESQTFKILTLGMYLGGLGGMGMTLAIYHLFLWDSRMPALPEFKQHHHIG